MTAQTTTSLERRPILARAFTTVGVMTLAMFAVLFLSAGTFAWPQAWVYLALFIAYFVTWISWGLRKNPDLIFERAQAMERGGESWDRVIVRLNVLVSLLNLLVAGLAIRYQAPAPAFWLQATGFGFLLLGYVLPFLALTNNPFASGVVRIQTERGHRVASKGPYQVVRHPMYAGTLLAALGAPVFLGSYWALLPGLLHICLLVYRTAREDDTLQAELVGYKDYAQKVRFRLLPGLW